MFENWDQDCIRWMGRLLIGKYAHWCPEWDYLPIDETCMEFTCCYCYEETDNLKAKLREEFDVSNVQNRTNR